MVPCVAFWHMDTTNCNLSKIGSKIIAIRFCETWNCILKACIALKQEGDEKWKTRNSINSEQLCLTSTKHFWKMYRKWKFPNFQIYGFYDFFSLQNFKCLSYWLHGCCGEWEGGPVNQVNHTSWVAVVTPTDRPKSFRNCCLIELFVVLFVFSLSPFDISVGVGAFVIGLGQISSFLSPKNEIYQKPSKFYSLYSVT